VLLSVSSLLAGAGVAQASQGEKWNMTLSWEYTFAIPTLSDPCITRDGRLIALLQSDGGRLLLFNRTGEIWEKDTGCELGLMAMNDHAIFVVGTFTGQKEFSGLRILDFSGRLAGEVGYWYGLVADDVEASPNGDYLWYLVSGHVGCYDFKNRTFSKRTLDGVLYNILEPSNDGHAIVTSDGSYDKVVLMDADGTILWEKEPTNKAAKIYNRSVVLSDGGITYLVDPQGEILRSFDKGELNSRDLPLMNSDYVIAYFNDSAYFFDYNLTPLFHLPGIPAAVNEKYLLTRQGIPPTLRLYDIAEREEVWHYQLPASFRSVKMSDDAKTVIALEDTGEKAWPLVAVGEGGVLHASFLALFIVAWTACQGTPPEAMKTRQRG